MSIHSNWIYCNSDVLFHSNKFKLKMKVWSVLEFMSATPYQTYYFMLPNC